MVGNRVLSVGRWMTVEADAGVCRSFVKAKRHCNDQESGRLQRVCDGDGGGGDGGGGRAVVGPALDRLCMILWPRFKALLDMQVLASRYAGSGSFRCFTLAIQVLVSCGLGSKPRSPHAVCSFFSLSAQRLHWLLLSSVYATSLCAASSHYLICAPSPPAASFLSLCRSLPLAIQL